MDCVGCEKCRLWGKLQVLGLGTALKILFSVNGQEDVRQTVSTFSRISLETKRTNFSLQEHQILNIVRLSKLYLLAIVGVLLKA